MLMDGFSLDLTSTGYGTSGLTQSDNMWLEACKTANGLDLTPLHQSDSGRSLPVTHGP